MAEESVSLWQRFLIGFYWFLRLLPGLHACIVLSTLDLVRGRFGSAQGLEEKIASLVSIAYEEGCITRKPHPTRTFDSSIPVTLLLSSGELPLVFQIQQIELGLRPTFNHTRVSPATPIIPRRLHLQDLCSRYPLSGFQGQGWFTPSILCALDPTVFSTLDKTCSSRNLSRFSQAS